VKLISDLWLITWCLVRVLGYLAYASGMLLVGLVWLVVWLVRLALEPPPTIAPRIPQRPLKEPQRAVQASKPPTWTLLPLSYERAAMSRLGSRRRREASQGTSRGRWGASD
jgi:hypothetical protein